MLLKTDGKTVRRVGQTEVGTLAEGIAFSPDGRFLYIANGGNGDEKELAAMARSDGFAPFKILSTRLTRALSASRCLKARWRCRP